MYSVGWADRAAADLRDKVKSRPVKQKLVQVSETSLHRHCPRWGGEIPLVGGGTRLYRHGVDVAEETHLDSLDEDPHVNLDNGVEVARNFVLIYRVESRRLPGRYTVTCVMTKAELAAGYLARPELG